MARFKTMTQREARDLIAWVKTQPEIIKAYTDPKHPQHREVVKHANAAYYWTGHPVDENGQPRTWDIPDAAPNIFDDISADDARQTIESVKANPNLRAVLFDKTHPQHKQAATEWKDLHERAHPEPPPGTLANSPVVKSEGEIE